METFQ
jgi:chromosomal replication initiation ATPase DnaA